MLDMFWSCATKLTETGARPHHVITISCCLKKNEALFDSTLVHGSHGYIFKQHFWHCEESVSATCCLKCSMAHIHFNIPKVPCATIADLSNSGKIQTILENNPDSEYETLGQPLRCGEMTDVAWPYLFRRTMVDFKTLRIIWWVNTRKFNNDFQWATSLAARVLVLLETARMCHGWAVGNLQKQPPCHVFPNWRLALLIHMCWDVFAKVEFCSILFERFGVPNLFQSLIFLGNGRPHGLSDVMWHHMQRAACGAMIAESLELGTSIERWPMQWWYFFVG